MKTNSFFYLLLAFALTSAACGLSQAAPATQTAVAETTIVASWTVTPTLTPTLTPTEPFTPTPTETETPIPTSDPCLLENLAAAVQAIDDLQAQFDHQSSLAANAELEQVPDKITILQSILETATDQDTPPCLQVLKDHQLKHMNLVVDTLVAFVNGANARGETIRNLTVRAREEYYQYTLELTRLQGMTPTPSLKETTFSDDSSLHGAFG